MKTNKQKAQKAIPVINLKVETKHVTAKVRKLKGNWKIVESDFMVMGDGTGKRTIWHIFDRRDNSNWLVKNFNKKKWQKIVDRFAKDYEKLTIDSIDLMVLCDDEKIFEYAKELGILKDDN